MRDVPEWIGATDSTPVPPRVRLRVFERDGGRCQCGCNVLIRVGMKWETDHKKAISNGGENRERNLHTLLLDHHKIKTRADKALKAKTYAMKRKNLGLKKRSGFRGWRRMNGEIRWAEGRR